MASRHINLACLIFLLFVAFSSVLEAANLATRKEPRGELGVRLDHHFAVNGRNKKQGPDRAFRWLFSTYIVFKESVADIEPAQLQQIAIDAHQEMRDDIAQYAVDVDKEDQGVLPTVMTILAFDNQIILSSSQKGANGFIDGLEESPVRVALNICRAAFAQGSTPGKRQPQSGTRPDHRYSRKCGEVYAFHHYYQLNKQPLKKRNARVLAVSFEEYGEPAVYVPPCGTDRKNQWGCDVLAVELGVEVLEDEGTKPYDINTIAGGFTDIGQIQTCSREYVRWTRHASQGSSNSML